MPRTVSVECRQDHRHAARVGLGLLVPGMLLLLTGRPELILYAFFGSVTGMYGRRETPLERFRHQFHGAGMLLTGTVVGILLAESEAAPAVLVGCVTAFATAASLLTDRLRLRPGGPFFGIFALGATATVGPGLVSPWVAIAICAMAAAAVPLAVVSTGEPLNLRPVVERGLQRVTGQREWASW